MDDGGGRSPFNARVGGLRSLGLATFSAQTTVASPDLSLEMWRTLQKMLHFKFETWHNLATKNILSTQRWLLISPLHWYNPFAEGCRLPHHKPKRLTWSYAHSRGCSLFWNVFGSFWKFTMESNLARKRGDIRATIHFLSIYQVPGASQNTTKYFLRASFG